MWSRDRSTSYVICVPRGGWVWEDVWRLHVPEFIARRGSNPQLAFDNPCAAPDEPRFLEPASPNVPWQPLAGASDEVISRYAVDVAQAASLVRDGTPSVKHIQRLAGTAHGPSGARFFVAVLLRGSFTAQHIAAAQGLPDPSFESLVITFDGDSGEPLSIRPCSPPPNAAWVTC